jgi:uncharacterized protein
MDPVVTQFIERIHHAFHEGDQHAAQKAAEQTNVSRTQQQYRALATGDAEGFAATLSDDVEMEIFGPPELPFAGRWRGRDEVLKAVAHNFGLIEEQRPEVESVVAQGDTVVVFARERGRFKATKREYEIRWVQWFTFRDGLMCRFRELAEADPLIAASRS